MFNVIICLYVKNPQNHEKGTMNPKAAEQMKQNASPCFTIIQGFIKGKF